jgi:hypothetical protein
MGTNATHLLAALIFLAMLAPAIAQPPPPKIECVDVDDETRDKVRAIILSALDEALKEQVKRLFTVWMVAEEAPGRARARQGTRLGIRSYITARTTILNTEWHCPKKE